MLAVIKTGGKQYLVKPKDVISIEKIKGDVNEEVSFNDVLLFSDEKSVKLGTPILEGASVKAKILEQGREKKKIVFRYKPKTRQSTKKGHRQNYTKISIMDIVSG